jgi:hypothetical protein
MTSVVLCYCIYYNSNYDTRINFKVIPNKNTKTLSVLYSIIRILAAMKAINWTTRILATDKDRNETDFKGEQPMHEHLSTNLSRNQE